jgi:hypothetical protein
MPREQKLKFINDKWLALASHGSKFLPKELTDKVIDSLLKAESPTHLLNTFK